MKNSRIAASSPVGRKRTELRMVGSGKYGYIWIGSDDVFHGFIDNTPTLRKFLRGALKRLTAPPMGKTARKREVR